MQDLFTPYSPPQQPLSNASSNATTSGVKVGFTPTHHASTKPGTIVIGQQEQKQHSSHTPIQEKSEKPGTIVGLVAPRPISRSRSGSVTSTSNNPPAGLFVPISAARDDLEIGRSRAATTSNNANGVPVEDDLASSRSNSSTRSIRRNSAENRLSFKKKATSEPVVIEAPKPWRIPGFLHPNYFIVVFFFLLFT